MTVLETMSTISRETVERLSALKSEPEWMLEFRLAAWQKYESLPMPSTKDEQWRQTNLKKVKLEDLRVLVDASGAGPSSHLDLGDRAAGSISQRNSQTVHHWLQESAATQGIIFCDLDTAVQQHPDLVRKYFMTQAITPDFHKFSALHAALWSGGAFLFVPRGVTLSLPVSTLYALTDSGGIFTHTLVVLEEGAQAAVVEEYVSHGVTAQALNAGVVEVVLEQDAKLTLVSVQDWNDAVIDITAERAVIGRNARLDWLIVGMGDGTVKANVEAALVGPGAEVQMLGVLWGHGTQHTDYHTVQDHVAPHTTSDLLYKAALSDEAKSVFSGRIRVEKGAQGTDAYQTNRSLLLSDKAAAYPSPNLEIEANEVRCSHGASVGKVDADQLFYLMARGISRQMATRMIVEGFFADVLARNPLPGIRDQLQALIERTMNLEA